jgi:hypothetical protein
MADSLKATFDTSQWDAVLAKLAGPAAESLARRMCVSGGVILRDEAKINAPQGVAEEQAIRQYGGSIRPGALKDAIYLAFRDGESSKTLFKYSVTWNAKKAPHGHLVEFGHWQPYRIVFTKDRGWQTLINHPLPTPSWVPGMPFLRPTFDANLGRVKTAMIERGRAEIQILLQE